MLKNELHHPTARRSVGSVVHKNNFYIYGGFGVNGTVAKDDIGDDFWIYENDRFHFINNGPYKARYTSLCSNGEHIFLFGGCSFKNDDLYFENRLFYFADNSWKEIQDISDERPIGRYTNALCYYEDKLFIFGGYSYDKDNKPLFLNDVWFFDIKSKVWNKIKEQDIQPSNRYGFSWTQNNNLLYIFGGYDNNKDLNDLWSFNFNTLQ